MSEDTDNQDVGLEAATIERVRNSSLVKCPGADNVAGLKRNTETVESSERVIGRGAFWSAVKVYRKEDWSGQK